MGVLERLTVNVVQTQEKRDKILREVKNVGECIIDALPAGELAERLKAAVC